MQQRSTLNVQHACDVQLAVTFSRSPDLTGSRAIYTSEHTVRVLVDNASMSAKTRLSKHTVRVLVDNNNELYQQTLCNTTRGLLCRMAGFATLPLPQVLLCRRA